MHLTGLEVRIHLFSLSAGVDTKTATREWEVLVKQSEVEQMLARLEASVEASHKAQVELLQAVRQMFVEQKAIAKPKPPREVDPDIELAALDDAKYDGLPDEAVFTVPEVAKLFRVSGGTVREMVRQRRIPSLTMGSRILIPRRALVAFLRGMDADDFDKFIKRKVEARQRI
jgi:excisionase family DNA binding protein